MPSNELLTASNLIKKDGVIISPTDTLYGLVANIFSKKAVHRIFDIKNRDINMALPVLVCSWEQALPLIAGDLSLGFSLQEQFWPGALTMIFKKTPLIPDYLTSGKDTVAIRMPSHPAPLFICKTADTPITGTSANLSGERDALTLSDISPSIKNSVDLVITTPPSPLGTPSTIVDLSGPQPQIVREGALNITQVLKKN